MDAPPPLDADRLLEHAAWVRRLARRLVSDPNVADDAAQDALTAALRSGPREASRTQAWFAAVVRSFVRRRARGEERRARREEAVAQPERLEPTDEIVERAMASRAVVDAVIALPEPYRTTILLRWFDDVPPARIAEIRGEPVETVRTRLKRGHALLRERLSGLQALVLLAAPVHSAVTMTGGLVMTTLGKFAIAAAVAALAVATWTMVPSRGPTRVSTATADAHATRESVDAASLAVPVAGTAEVVERERAESNEGAVDPAKHEVETPAKDSSRWSDLTAESWQRLIRNDDSEELRTAVSGLESESLDLSALLQYVHGWFEHPFIAPGTGETKQSGDKKDVSGALIYENSNGERSVTFPSWSRSEKGEETAGLCLPAMFWSEANTSKLDLPPESLRAYFVIHLRRAADGALHGMVRLNPGPSGNDVESMNANMAKVKQLEDAKRLPSDFMIERVDGNTRVRWTRSGAGRALSSEELQELGRLFDAIASTARDITEKLAAPR